MDKRGPPPSYSQAAADSQRAAGPNGWFMFQFDGAEHQVPFVTLPQGKYVRVVLNAEKVSPPINMLSGGTWHWYLEKMFRASKLSLSKDSTPDIFIFDVSTDKFNHFKHYVLDKPDVEWSGLKGTWHSTKQAGGRKRRRGGSRGRGSRRGYRRGPRRGTRRGSRRSH